ncbi:hypothetical protein RHMOL_Rhmol09G0192600 [Rhododendron molle]|uniref:Uncharacterized protein n=1 Tax=Rhododendron molle TaxID=49168 RepID=A0ACC0MFN2_RHOML|nr:hypothetical protein RHMOL_Rhmol09G0192600 [Rhododendron molle]
MKELPVRHPVSSGKSLGFVVHRRGIEIDPSKIKAIPEMQRQCPGLRWNLRKSKYVKFLVQISFKSVWSDKTDVLPYGVILLGLIAKRVYDLKNARYLGTLNYVFFWAWTEYNENPAKTPSSSCGGMYKKHKKSQSNKSLVDKSLESDQYFDPGDGVEITNLAMRCVEENPERQPMMKEVVCCLRESNVVKKSCHVVLPKMYVGSSGGDGILCTSSPGLLEASGYVAIVY